MISPGVKIHINILHFWNLFEKTAKFKFKLKLTFVFKNHGMQIVHMYAITDIMHIKLETIFYYV